VYRSVHSIRHDEAYFEMVEAAGVEPASENSGSLAPTCLALAFDLVLACPESKERLRTSLSFFVARCEAVRRPLAHIMTLVPQA
jgi:hypothetical protein